MKIQTNTFVEKKMLGTVNNHMEVPAWVASFENCGVCEEQIALDDKVVVADLDFDDGHGENRFFHKACFNKAKKA